MRAYVCMCLAGCWLAGVVEADMLVEAFLLYTRVGWLTGRPDGRTNQSNRTNQSTPLKNKPTADRPTAPHLSNPPMND